MNSLKQYIVCIKMYIKLRNKYVREHGNISIFVLLRYFAPWFQSLNNNKSPIEDRIPWIVFSAFKYLNAAIKKNDKVFEYGMGGSTLYFLDKGCDVVSIEHDLIWFNKLRDLIPIESKWRGLFVPYQLISQSDSSEKKYRSLFPGYKDKSFENYILQLNVFPDKYFDIIFIDGRARADGLKIAKNKIKQSGIIILDNAERTRYINAISELVGLGWEQKRYVGSGPFVNYELWETHIFMAPTKVNNSF